MFANKYSKKNELKLTADNQAEFKFKRNFKRIPAITTERLRTEIVIVTRQQIRITFEQFPLGR